MLKCQRCQHRVLGNEIQLLQRDWEDTVLARNTSYKYLYAPFGMYNPIYNYQLVNVSYT